MNIKESEKLNNNNYEENKKKKKLYLIIALLLLFIIAILIKFGFKFTEHILNIDIDDDNLPDVMLDLDNDGVCDINCNIDSNRKPLTNIDLNKDHKPHFNVDTNNDGNPDFNLINQDLDNDGVCDINCDTTGDGWPDLNIDLTGNKICDLNCDTNKDQICDKKCDTNSDGICDIYCNEENEIIVDDEEETYYISLKDIKNLTATNIIPGWTGTQSFQIINNTEQDLSYDIIWTNVVNEFTNDNNIYYSITKNNKALLSNLRAPYYEETIIENDIISAYSVNTYIINYEFKNLDIDQSVDTNKSFKANIMIKAK